MGTSATLAPEFQGHRAPPGSVAVKAKFCENCGKNFFRCSSSLRVLCCTCHNMLNTRCNQLWRCWECGMERTWGEGRPEETREKRLKCDRCGDVTEHLFAKVV